MSFGPAKARPKPTRLHGEFPYCQRPRDLCLDACLLAESQQLARAEKARQREVEFPGFHAESGSPALGYALLGRKIYCPSKGNQFAPCRRARRFLQVRTQTLRLVL